MRSVDQQHENITQDDKDSHFVVNLFTDVFYMPTYSTESHCSMGYNQVVGMELPTGMGSRNGSALTATKVRYC